MAVASTHLTNFLESIRIKQTPPPFSLQDVEGFPFEEYSKRHTLYTEMENWYSGAVLNAAQDRAGEKVSTYPVKVNPLKSTVQKHTFALFGEVEEDDGPLVSPKVIYKDDAEKIQAEIAEQVLIQTWWENNGRSIQWESGARSQVYGGCIFRINYDPTEKLRSIPLRIEPIHPKYFVGRPDAMDYWRLKEAWIVRPISVQEAREHGYTVDSLDNSQQPYLIEHYTEQRYEAWVNNTPAKRYIDGEWRELSGENIFGLVPVVYIPHIRIDGFYGENVIDSVKGIIKEWNLRLADYGDAVSQDAHGYLGMRNVSKQTEVKQLAPSVFAIDVGSTPNFTGQDPQPDLWELFKSKASTQMKALVDTLIDQYRRDAFVPKVADGEDEGSQRSGLTLAMRMLSLLWHTSAERVFWTSGLNLINRMILSMLATINFEEITEEMAFMRIRQDWAPVLPRDREMLVTEVIARAGAKMGSPETLLKILGDVPDIEQEIKDIIEFTEELAEAEAKATPPPTNGTDPSKTKTTEK